MRDLTMMPSTPDVCLMLANSWRFNMPSWFWSSLSKAAVTSASGALPALPSRPAAAAGLVVEAAILGAARTAGGPPDLPAPRGGVRRPTGTSLGVLCHGHSAEAPTTSAVATSTIDSPTRMSGHHDGPSNRPGSAAHARGRPPVAKQRCRALAETRRTTTPGCRMANQPNAAQGEGQTNW